MGRTILVSNRVPRPGDRGIGQGGLVVSLAKGLTDGGLWFGWSGRTRADASLDAEIRRIGKTSVAAIDLTREEYERYYIGYANRVLWPLFHFRLGLMEYRREYADAYRAVNLRFARALQPLLRSDDVVWVHDYHLIPLGSALRSIGCQNRLGFFLHTPFVPPSMFAVLPDAQELLMRMCDYDVVGFQTSEHRRDFLDCIRHILEFPIDCDGVVRSRSSRTVVIDLPVGIDVREFAAQSRRAAKTTEVHRLIESMADRMLVLGVDRLDYSKGLPNRFEAYSRLLRRYPEHRTKVSYLQIAAKSREDVDEYQQLKRELDRMVGRINGRFAEFDWVPIRYLTRPLARATIAGFYRAANVGLVTPLRDGMNLVAKEFVAAQDSDDPGVLILSKFAGASEELGEALVVNPFDPDDVAEKLHVALTMTGEERRQRHRALLAAISANTAERFCHRFLDALKCIDGKVIEMKPRTIVRAGPATILT